MAAASAVLSAVVTAGVMHFLQDTPAPTISPQTYARPDPSAGLKAREDALAEKEAALDARARRERATAPVAAAERPEVSIKPATVDAQPKEPTPEEKARQDALAIAAKMGGSLMRLAKMHGRGEEASDDERMQLASDLLPALMFLQKQRKEMVGDAAVDFCLTLFDSAAPEERLKSSADQKARFRQSYLDAERLLDANGIPKHLLFPVPTPGSQRNDLQPSQQEQLRNIQQDLNQQIQGLATPDQSAFLTPLGAMGERRAQRPRGDNPPSPAP